MLGACGPLDPLPKEGKLGYPQLNPNPEQAIPVHIVASKTLTVVILAQYATSSRAFGCEGYSGEMDSGPKFISRPVALKPDGSGGLEGRAYIDGVLPGRCGWRFIGLSQTVSKGALSSAVNGMLIFEPNALLPANSGFQPYSPSFRPVLHCRTSSLGRHAFIDCSAGGEIRRLYAQPGQEAWLTYVDDDGRP